MNPFEWRLKNDPAFRVAMRQVAPLKPCPFCQGTGGFRYERYSGTMASGMEPETVFAGCAPCGVWFKGGEEQEWRSGKGWFSFRAQAHERAVAAWNRRSNGPAPDGHLLGVAAEAATCCLAWEGRALLLGNCRADDLYAIFSRFLAEHGHPDGRTEGHCEPSEACAGADPGDAD